MRTKEEYQEALDFISDNTKPDVKSAKDLESLEFFYNKIQELIDLYPEYLELKKRAEKICDVSYHGTLEEIKSELSNLIYLMEGVMKNERSIEDVYGNNE